MPPKKHTAGDISAVPKKLAAAAAAVEAVAKNRRKAERYDDIMLDLETLNTDVDGVILSIGAVRFNETSIADEAFYRVITIQSNLDEHRTISPSTLRWWLDQDAKAKAVLDDPNKIPLGQALDEFREWIGNDCKTVKMWGNGSDFDCSMVKHAYGQQSAPWEFFNTRCFRTIKSMPAAKLVPKPENTLAHNALADAIAQAKHLQAIWAAGVGK